ncbi:cell wall metabolism sensor histidine kinase WalK [Alicyclobacillus sp. SO9]|uniref:sensor histidine kinase n=1 Tax=Alicyclobacillus sp. SO9 TaxID=2665646 RepID=UPI0018E8944C|nr:HAMP domain-containing sensor histidine kinase [Alicyclobacillus sp. SO9]QQE79809.1 HAMP domain-containing histidine kinase [Alicyclobacillus sp. SO9]
MIRRSIVAKMTLTITALVLFVLAILYIALTQLFHNALFHSALKGTSGESLTALTNIAQWLFVLAGFGAVLLAAGLAMILSNQLTRPLVRMAAVTQSMISGTYNTKVAVSGEDEIARLGQSINGLAQNLEFLNTSRNQFLADISHELRTPLSYIHGYSEVLKEGLAQSEQDKDNYLEIIYEESGRIERLITNLFDLARAQEGSLQIELESTDVKRVVRKVVEHLRPFAATKNARLAIDIDVTHRLRVDALRLEQVVFNLVDNAVRYAPADGLVRVTAVEEGGILEIQVSDNGPGIPEEDLPHIFDRLYRVDKSRSRNSGGTGLGLAIVKQIAELHGGSVHAQSSLNHGTSIRVRIPAIKA